MPALPEVFDLLRILADEKRRQVLFDRGNHGIWLKVIPRRTDAVEPRFARDDLDEDPAVVATAAGGDHLYLLDRQGRKPLRHRGEDRSGPEGTEEIAAEHARIYITTTAP